MSPVELARPCLHAVTVRGQDGATYCALCCRPMITALEAPQDDDAEHVFLVAVTVRGSGRQHAEARLMALLPVPDQEVVTEWWVAEDDRQDGSDNDSAVFVKRGQQTEAHQVLSYYCLTAGHNDPRRQRG